MYRPHFGEGSRVAGSELEAHIWDRALQLDMDRQVQTQHDGFPATDEAIPDSEQGVEISFLDQEVLREWRSWVSRFLGWDFTWERLKRALNRMYRDDDVVQQVVDRFLEEMPHSMERIYQKIPREKLEAYQQRTLAETVAQAREYLSGA